MGAFGVMATLPPWMEIGLVWIMTTGLFLWQHSCRSTYCRRAMWGESAPQLLYDIVFWAEFQIPFLKMGRLSVWTYFELMDISSVFSNYSVISQGRAFPDLKRIPNSVWNSICVPRAASWSHLNTLRCAWLSLPSSFYLTWLKESARRLTSHIQAFSVVFCMVAVNKQIMCILHIFCLNE